MSEKPRKRKTKHERLMEVAERYAKNRPWDGLWRLSRRKGGRRTK